MRSICLLPQPLDAKVRGVKYHEANDLETEIRRARQTSGTTGLLVMSVPTRVYIVGGTRKTLTSVVLPSPGLGQG